MSIFDPTHSHHTHIQYRPNNTLNIDIIGKSPSRPVQPNLVESDGRIDGNSGPICPVTVMPLTNLKVDKAKPKEKQYKLADERGMYLLVHPKGGKWWWTC